MFEFECFHLDSIGDKWIPKTYIAATPGKAKYQHFEYLHNELSYGDGFADLIKGMKCKKIGIACINFFFGDVDMFDRMKVSRGIPFAYMGMKISVCGKQGKIVGSNSGLNLDVVFDGEWNKRNCHPWYETVYYDNNGNILADYRENKGQVVI